MDNLVKLLDQNPEMIGMTEKYLTGVLKSQGKLDQTN